jgi:hypothetical protein
VRRIATQTAERDYNAANQAMSEVLGSAVDVAALGFQKGLAVVGRRDAGVM